MQSFAFYLDFVIGKLHQRLLRESKNSQVYQLIADLILRPSNSDQTNSRRRWKNQGDQPAKI